jgi:hypothetical protein
MLLNAARPPVRRQCDHHAGLRKRERHKCTNREERDQTIGYSFEGNEQRRGPECQYIDAERKHKSATTGREQIRQPSVFRDGATKAGNRQRKYSRKAPAL